MVLARHSLVFLLVALVAIGSSCGGTSSNESTGGGALLPAAPGVGAACSATTACRAGLSCDKTTKTCQPTHTTPLGHTCLLDDECVSGAYCDAAHSCAAAGSLASGTRCYGDGACEGGLRCVLAGISATCDAEGPGDLSASCSITSDCKGGLACIGKHCAQLPAGVPIFGHSQWSGETCAADGTVPTAYFRVPRGTASDGDFYRLPFPNDIRVAAGHVDLSNHPTPGSDLLGYDVADRWLRAIEAGPPGFSAYPSILFRFSAPIDRDSFRGSGVITMVDLTKGAPDQYAQQGLAWYASDARGKYICDNWLGVRPPEGQPLTPGHTYGVLLTTAGVSASKTSFRADDDLDALLADSPPADATLAKAYPAYAPLRTYLDARSIAASTILNASVFTVGSIVSPLQGVATLIDATPAVTASQWIRCGDAADPCPDTTGDRACGTADPSFDELHALLALPIYQSGSAPYSTPADGGGVDLSSPLTKPIRIEPVCMALTVPRTEAMPPAGWPLVVYAHDTGGSYRSAVNDGVSAMLATASPSPMAVLTIDQVLHGPRQGTSRMDPRSLLFNLQNPAATLGNAVQGALDQATVARFAIELSLTMTASPTGAAISADPLAIGFWGHALGAIEGGAAVPYSTAVQGAVFSAMSAGVVDRLLETTTPDDIAALLPLSLEDADPTLNYELAGREFNPMASLFQAYLDPVDPLNHAANIASFQPGSPPPHHIFQVYGQGDTTCPPVTQATYAVAALLALVAPDPTVTTPDDVPDLTTVLGPLSGNETSADGKTHITAAVREYQAAAGADGHLVAFQVAPARTDISRFFTQLAGHQVPQVGP